MRVKMTDLQVITTPDGMYPQAVRWHGGIVRVLGVERLRTSGTQRRFRVRTPEGAYDLGFSIDSGGWQVLRRPGWLERVRARLAAAPRYPLPASQRRTCAPCGWRSSRPTAGAEGGVHASRLALVRQ